jgi:pyruvate dehydrogenase E1 component alpha subunit
MRREGESMSDAATKRLADYGKVLLIRLFEERVQALYDEGAIRGTLHLCIGQEAAAVGIADALNPGDQAVSSHRGHGHLLAMGGAPERLLGELMGKSNGYCRGKGGSQHLSAPEIGFLGTNGITGGGIPIATGAALTAKMKHPGRVVVCFFGDGATSQGVFHESLNMASLWKLPVLYVCENNGYAMSESVARTVAGGDLSARARAYAMPVERADGMDVEAVESAARGLLERVRTGHGPAFLEAITYRFCGHSKSDQLVYRTREEEADWRKRDPLLLARRKADHVGAAEAARVDTEVRKRLADAEAACRAAPDCDPGEALKGVYADG